MAYKLIAWDFDGTLADTLHGALAIYNGLAGRHGFRPIKDPEAVRGMTTAAFLKAHRVPLLKVPLLLREFLAAQKSRMDQVRLCAGVAELVRALRGDGVRQGVISSNNEQNIRTCLRANGVEDCFEFVVGYSRLFGKQQAIRRILKQRKCPPGELLYVGDEVRDIEAARAAGVDVASVTWGLNTEDLLAEHRPTRLLRAADDLRRIVGGLRETA